MRPVAQRALAEVLVGGPHSRVGEPLQPRLLARGEHVDVVPVRRPSQGDVAGGLVEPGHLARVGAQGPSSERAGAYRRVAAHEGVLVVPLPRDVVVDRLEGSGHGGVRAVNVSRSAAHADGHGARPALRRGPGEAARVNSHSVRHGEPRLLEVGHVIPPDLAVDVPRGVLEGYGVDPAVDGSAGHEATRRGPCRGAGAAGVGVHLVAGVVVLARGGADEDVDPGAPQGAADVPHVRLVEDQLVHSVVVGQPVGLADLGRRGAAFEAQHRSRFPWLVEPRELEAVGESANPREAVGQAVGAGGRGGAWRGGGTPPPHDAPAGRFDRRARPAVRAGSCEPPSPSSQAASGHLDQPAGVEHSHRVAVGEGVHAANQGGVAAVRRAVGFPGDGHGALARKFVRHDVPPSVRPSRDQVDPGLALKVGDLLHEGVRRFVLGAVLVERHDGAAVVGREDHQAVSATELEGAFQDGLGGVHFLREGRPLGLLGRPWGLMHLDFAWWGRRSWHEVRAPSELACGVAVPQQVVLVGQS